MFNKTLPLMVLSLIAGCATTPPPAEQAVTEPPPVEIAPPPPVATAQPHDTASDSDANPDEPMAPPPKPGQTDTGRFRISIASLDSAELTAAWVRKAEAAGYRTEIWEVAIDGKAWHRVLLPGYASLADAQAALPAVQQELGAPGAWVTSRRRAPAPDSVGAAEPAAPPPPAPPAEMPVPEPAAN